MGRSYKVNELFFSLQGEGHWAGHRVLFLRLAGCNMSCPYCDTRHQDGEDVTLPALIERVDLLHDEHGVETVVVTGGEPFLQLDEALVKALGKDCGMVVHVETNGSLPPPSREIDWITVSPKVPYAQVVENFRSAGIDELKVVLAPGEQLHPFPWGDMDCERAELQFVSPQFRGDVCPAESMEWAVKQVLDHPEWALTMQAHKIWGCR